MVNEYYLKPPSEQQYYKVMACILCLSGFNNDFWPFYKMPNNIIFNLYRHFMKICASTCFLSQIIYLVKYYGQRDFYILASSYCIASIAFALMIKTMIAQTSSYKKVMIEFMEHIHVFCYYRQNNQPHVKKILIETETSTRWSLNTLTISTSVLTSVLLVVPIFHNYQNIQSIHNITAPLEIAIHFWLPIDYEFNFINWVIMQIVVLYCTVAAGLMIAVFDTTNFSFIFHLIAHTKILKHVLREEFKENMTHEQIKCKLIEVTRYYFFIKRIFKHVEDAFGLNILGIYLHILCGGGIMFYMIMTAGNDLVIYLTYGLMIIIYMGELIFMSLILENVRIEADNIPELVYNLRWEKMNISNQKMLLIILAQVQPVLEFKAAFDVKTGVQPAINIIKTAFSYYVLVKSRT